MSIGWEKFEGWEESAARLRNAKAKEDWRQGLMQVPVAPQQLPSPTLNGLTEHDVERIAAAVVRVTSERDATIAELRAEIARLNEANVRLSSANADLHRDVTWRAAEIARMTLAANAWHQT